jgi:hypothetical protein
MARRANGATDVAARNHRGLVGVVREGQVLTADQ